MPMMTKGGMTRPTASPFLMPSGAAEPGRRGTTRGTGCSAPSTSSDAREAVAPDVPAQRGAVPLSGVDLVRPTALVVAGAGLVPVPGFMERGPRQERAEHRNASERD